MRHVALGLLALAAPKTGEKTSVAGCSSREAVDVAMEAKEKRAKPLFSRRFGAFQPNIIKKRWKTVENQ